MKALLLVIALCGLLAAPARAQTEDFDLHIDAESAVIRSIPSREGEFVASAFDGERLEAVGRNLDGLWFQVRRPGRMHILGWISRTVIRYDFFPERLPLTDLSVGFAGETLLEADPGFAAFALSAINVRREPWVDENEIGLIPFGVVVPVVGRNEDGGWMLVNYLGTQGWVDVVNLRGLPAPLEVPPAANIPQRPAGSQLGVAAVAIIPLEVQLAALAEFRTYLSAQASFATQLDQFWTAVLGFERMHCQPPDFVLAYLDSPDRRRVFPEIEYLAPRTETASAFLNQAIDPLYICGVLNPQVVRDARNAATNAAIIYAATLGAVDNIERQILANR